MNDTLQDRLDAFKKTVDAKIPAATRAIMDRTTEELRALGQVERALGAGGTLPPFVLPNQRGEPVSSDQLLSRGPLVISLFRGAWCPYCMIEMAALQEALPRFRKAGATLVAITPQTVETSARMVEEKAITFDVLTDHALAYVETLGLAFELPEELRAVYRGFGIDLPRVNAVDVWRLPIPGRFVVTREGVVADALVDPDYTVRPDPAQTLAVLAEL